MLHEGIYRVLRTATLRDVAELPVFERRDGTAITYNCEYRIVGIMKPGVCGEYFMPIDASICPTMLDFNQEWVGGTVGDFVKHNHTYVMVEYNEVEQQEVFTRIV